MQFRNWLGTGAMIVTAVVLPCLAAKSAEPSCKLYKSNAPILDARADPAKAGGYVDILEQGEIACVTEIKKIGKREWGYVAHKILNDGKKKPIKGWVGLRFMDLQQGGASAGQAAATSPKSVASAAPSAVAKAQPSATKPATPEDQGQAAVLSFTQPLEFGPYPIRGTSLRDLALGKPIFSPVDGLPEKLWQKTCTSCHKWNEQRLCDQGKSYIKSAAAVFRHQHPYGGPYKLALMRWAKTGCK